MKISSEIIRNFEITSDAIAGGAREDRGVRGWQGVEDGGAAQELQDEVDAGVQQAEEAGAGASRRRRHHVSW